MMILFINICMVALLLITAMLWSEYRRDIKMAKYRKEIEALEQQETLDGCPAFFLLIKVAVTHFGAVA